ncbi:uncharacterized protein LOC132728565 [Ruditapes philippinarum]|uniref:uncharacterized protein LOC132728565 n=1 Tax=Ruditapes philippinarum TaxID=129788 RepID=UPI00295ACD3C|nr:uncharacterized protein LOC132728565 [Ruditapes philippinarum]
MLSKVGALILFLMIFISFCQESISVKLFCGSGLNLTKYDNETQECNDGHVIDRRNFRPLLVPPTTNFNSTSIILQESVSVNFFCGINLTTYDNETQECNEGKVVDRNVRPLVVPPTTNLNFTSIILQDDRSNKSSTDNTSLSNVTFTCNGRTFSTYTNKKGTVGCCGIDVYQPNEQTCCQLTSNEYKIHDNKPERNHVCCGVHVFARSSTNLPCQHGSLNEAFISGKLPTLSTIIEICWKNFVFYVKITGEEETKDRRNLFISVTQYEWHGIGSYLRPVQTRWNIKAPLDKYSQKLLKRETFVIFSNYEYLDDVVFYRHDGDAVFKASRRKYFVLRKLRQLLDTC